MCPNLEKKTRVRTTFVLLHYFTTQLSLTHGSKALTLTFSFFFRYCRFLARYSGLVLVSISTLSVIAIICSLTLHQLPDFTDPQAVSNRYKKHFSFQSWKSVESLQTSTKFNLPLFFFGNNYNPSTIVILLTLS